MGRNKGCVEVIILFFLLATVLMILFPYMFIGYLAVLQREAANKTYQMEGVPVKIVAGENPDYTKWKENKASDWVGPVETTEITFKDGRVKKFHGICNFKILLDKQAVITYNNYSEITKIQQEKEDE